MLYYCRQRKLPNYLIFQAQINLYLLLLLPLLLLLVLSLLLLLLYNDRQCDWPSVGGRCFPYGHNTLHTSAHTNAVLRDTFTRHFVLKQSVADLHDYMIFT